MKLLRFANCQDPEGRYGNWDEALFFGINPVMKGYCNERGDIILSCGATAKDFHGPAGALLQKNLKAIKT
jgi:hypothetical protein